MNSPSRREFLAGVAGFAVSSGAFASPRTAESREAMNHPGVQFLFQLGFEPHEIAVEPYDYLGEQAQFPEFHSRVKDGFCLRVSSAGIERVLGGSANVDLVFSFEEFKHFSPKGVDPQHYWDRRYGLSVFPAFQEGAVSQFTIGSASLDSLEELGANVNLWTFLSDLMERLSSDEGNIFIDRLMQGYSENSTPLTVESIASLPGNQRLAEFLGALA